MRPTPANGGGATSRLITWGGNFALIAGFWLAMPYADDDLRLVVLIFQIGAVIIQVVGSINRPPARGAGVLAPLMIPASIAFYFIVYWERYSPA